MNPNDTAALALQTIFAGLPRAPQAATRRSPNIAQTITDVQREWDAPIEVASLPSVQIVPIDEGRGGVTVMMVLKTRYANYLGDLKPLVDVANSMKAQAEAMSHGPLTAKILRKMGHPYGRDWNDGKATNRKIGRSIGQVKGVRGAVPNLTVINISGSKKSEGVGTLAESWSSKVVATAFGAMLEITNSTSYAIFLAAGTRKMQSHGPWTFLPATFKAAIMGAWQKIIRDARLRYLAMNGGMLGGAR